MHYFDIPSLIRKRAIFEQQQQKSRGEEGLDT
jgi:hypothetical protein